MLKILKYSTRLLVDSVMDAQILVFNEVYVVFLSLSLQQ